MTCQINGTLREFDGPLGPAKTEIIIFHGFHQDSSMEARAHHWHSGDRSFLWPKDWLNEHLPGAHTFYIDYSASLRETSTENLDLIKIGQSLLTHLMESNVGQRCPLILLGYWFGGLVLELVCREASCRARSTRYESERIKLETFLNNVKGIFWRKPLVYEQPYVDIGAVVSDIPLLGFFSALTKDAARLSEAFDKLCTVYHWRTFSLTEIAQMDLLVRPFYEEQEWSLNLNAGAVVQICKPLGRQFQRQGRRLLREFFKEIQMQIALAKRREYVINVEGLDEHVRTMLEQPDTRQILMFGFNSLGKVTAVQKVFNGMGYISKVVRLDGANVVEEELSFQHWAGVSTTGLSISRKRQQEDDLLEQFVPFFQKQIQYLPMVHPMVHPKSPWRKHYCLGAGSFGTVYAATDKDGMWFAVKEVSLIVNDKRTQQSVAQLMQEVELLKNLQHKNIVQYLGTEKDHDHLYIFLELVSNGTLAGVYEKITLWSSQISAYTRQVLEGLRYLHERGIVHRDIKCANILVESSGICKLADFGLAKQIGRLSQIQSCKGTVNWMAPEVVHPNRSSGFPADIWSLGCLIIEMATGSPPYGHVEWQVVGYKLMHGNAPPIPDSLPVTAKDFVQRCLEVDPVKRPTAFELLQHPFVQENNGQAFSSQLSGCALQLIPAMEQTPTMKIPAISSKGKEILQSSKRRTEVIGLRKVHYLGT